MLRPGMPVEMGERAGVLNRVARVDDRGDEGVDVWWHVDWANGTHTVVNPEFLVDVEAREWDQAPMVDDDNQCRAVDSMGAQCWLAAGHRSRYHRNAQARFV